MRGSKIRGRKVRYKGNLLKSNAEFLVAKDLDHQGIKWIYEPKTFRFPTGWYMPDFYLPDTQAWIEVKAHIFPSKLTEEEARKLYDLCKEVKIVYLALPYHGFKNQVSYYPIEVHGKVIAWIDPPRRTL